MIVHEGKELNDSQMRPYQMTRRVAQNFYDNECEIFLVSGMPEGIGKTAYVNHVCADVYGYVREKRKEALQWLWSKAKPKDRPEDAVMWEGDWDAVKSHIEYLPERVVRRCKTMLERGIREPMLHWDDGGTWLNTMEYHDPFVIAFMEYLSLARSNWGAIIISTPVEEWVLKKLHTATGILRVRVQKPEGTDRRYIWKPRVAKAFRIIRYPNRLRPYWKSEWNDRFSAIMPDEFYGWYKPERDKYALIAAHKMEAALGRRRKLGYNVEKDENVLREVKDHIEEANGESKDFREVIDQLKVEA